MKNKKSNNKKSSANQSDRTDVGGLDSRFKTDARFIPISKNAGKTKIDDRFKGIFTEDKFKIRSKLFSL